LVHAALACHLEAEAKESGKGDGGLVLSGSLERAVLSDGRELAGVDAARIDGAELDPRSGTLSVAGVEIVRPRARLSRASRGARAGSKLALVASGTGAPRESARATASARLAGVGKVALEASFVPDPAAPSVSGTIAGRELCLGPLAPYLAPRSIDPLLEKGE